MKIATLARPFWNCFTTKESKCCLETGISQVEGRSGEKIRVCAKDGNGERIIEGTDSLVATGRAANTGGIGLEQAGVELNEHGFIKVNERLETTAANVWAMGDCAGRPQFTHAAYNDFRVVGRTQRVRGAARGNSIPSGEDADGRSAPDADRFRIARLHENNDRQRPRRNPGVTAFGVETSELMAAVQTAMVERMPYTLLRDAIFTHPTISEGLVFLLGQVEGRKD
ncbi:MAG: FAD-dependent oxidoreductase [Candidatus Binataceae bacterium]